MKKKVLLILILAFYAVSFTPKTASVCINGNEIHSTKILSIWGPGKMFENSINEFFKATLNTIVFDFPNHYENCINLLSNNIGHRLILFSFETALPKPWITSSGWTIGLFFGWLLRIVLLILIIIKTRRQFL